MRTFRLALLALCVLSLPARAAVFTVTKTADTLDGACDRDCSLREAIAAANGPDAEGLPDVVVIPPGIYRLTRLGAGEEGNATGDLDLHHPVVLVGAGAGSTVLSGKGFDRVLDVRAQTEIFGVTIRDGRVDGDGGGILVRPSLSPPRVLLHRSVVANNQAQGGGDGGGIAALGELEVRDSAILENHAEGDGGGIGTGENGLLSLTNVTVSGNRAAGSGGGLDYREDLAAISGSTIVLNQAQVSAGGLAVRQSPFPGEHLHLLGSIAAENVAPLDPDCSSAGGPTSRGYNVLGVRGSCRAGGSDRTGTPESPLRVVLHLPRTDLGPTPVHELVPGSPALDLVRADHCEPADQVGQARQAPCDAGAWEKVGRPVCVPGGSVLCLQNGRFRVSALWSLDDRFPGTPATAVPLTDDTGIYWFFGPENLEVMVKVLLGCAVNQRWWVFSSGLTDVGVTLRVEDLETGRVWEHDRPPGEVYPPRLDTGAFDCALPAAAVDPPAPGIPGPVSDVLVVTKTADTFDAICNHDCSLRDAVFAANAKEGTGVIVLGPWVYSLDIPGRGEEGGQTGDLDVTDSLVILGAGAKRTGIVGNGIDRVLDVHDTGSLELYDAAVRAGHAVTDHFHFGAGGGIQASGFLKLVRSHVTGNHAQEVGGGIHAFELEMRDSAVAGNVADRIGGGLSAVLADLENVTVSANQAGDSGGGVHLYVFSAALRHVTISGNSAAIGGGLSASLEDCAGGFPCHELFELERTIIAGNFVPAGNVRPDCTGLPVHTGASNLFGVGQGCNPGIDDRAGTESAPLDARLSPLDDHGGSTFTHALLPDSPAVDFAPALGCLAADQRGQARPVDGNGDGTALCDAGALERLPSCQPDIRTLCLGPDSRFRVTASWTVLPVGGAAFAVPLTLDTGAFWFFHPDNLELTVKVLDGCGVNGHHWVFVSGLTDVGLRVVVEDTLTGHNWSLGYDGGEPLPTQLDTNALQCVQL